MKEHGGGGLARGGTSPHISIFEAEASFPYTKRKRGFFLGC
jgi:hypothetical protein